MTNKQLLKYNGKNVHIQYWEAPCILINYYGVLKVITTTLFYKSGSKNSCRFNIISDRKTYKFNYDDAKYVENIELYYD